MLNICSSEKTKTKKSGRLKLIRISRFTKARIKKTATDKEHKPNTNFVGRMGIQKAVNITKQRRIEGRDSRSSDITILFIPKKPPTVLAVKLPLKSPVNVREIALVLWGLGEGAQFFPDESVILLKKRPTKLLLNFSSSP